MDHVQAASHISAEEGQSFGSDAAKVSHPPLPPSFDKMKRTSLLDIDYHCREAVLEMLLLNRMHRWCDATIDHELPSLCMKDVCAAEEMKRLGCRRICQHRRNVGNAAVLLVCRQLYLEGREILYGRNTFVSYNFPRLKNRLSIAIGRQNMARIQRLTLGLPMKHKSSDPTTYLGGFLEFLNDKLPTLCELSLTTEFGYRHGPGGEDVGGTQLGDEYRAMLNTAAWITCRHRKLRKAVWMAESGDIGAHSSPNGGSMLGWDWHTTVDDDGEIVRASNYRMCRFTVKILAENQRLRVPERRRLDLMRADVRVSPTSLSSRKADHLSEDIILNSQAIRRAGWSNLPAATPQDFALAQNAPSSEPPPTLIKRTEEGVIFADWQTVSDHLRDRFKYLSLKDHNRLTGDRVSKEQM